MMDLCYMTSTLKSNDTISHHFAYKLQILGNFNFATAISLPIARRMRIDHFSFIN